MTIRHSLAELKSGGRAGTLAPDYDLLQVAQQVAKKHNIVVVPDHIKSHQDHSRDYNDLPWQAKLNCDCDQMAGASRKCQICLDTLHKGYDLPTGHIASLEIDGLIITSHVATAIKEASYRREFIEYITQRAGWQDKETHHTIDWVACSRAGKQLSSGQGLTVFKLEFALFETMSQCHQMEQGIDHRCPGCQHFQETLVNVLCCPRASKICKGALTRALALIRKKTYMPRLVFKSSSYPRFFYFISKVFLPAVYWLILASILALFLTVLALFSHYSRFDYELKSLDSRV